MTFNPLCWIRIIFLLDCATRRCRWLLTLVFLFWSRSESLLSEPAKSVRFFLPFCFITLVEYSTSFSVEYLPFDFSTLSKRLSSSSWNSVVILYSHWNFEDLFHQSITDVVCFLQFLSPHSCTTPNLTHLLPNGFLQFWSWHCFSINTKVAVSSLPGLFGFVGNSDDGIASRDSPTASFNYLLIHLSFGVDHHDAFSSPF